MKRFSKTQKIFFAILILAALPLNIMAEVKDSTRVISPRKAFFVSMAFPGVGQMYLNRPLKAIGFASAEVFYIYKTIEYSRIYGYILETKKNVGIDNWNNMDEAEKREAVNRQAVVNMTDFSLEINSWRVREKRNKYAWWCAGVYFISILDAYVDAHLTNFPKNDVDVSAIADHESVGMNISFSIGKKK